MGLDIFAYGGLVEATGLRLDDNNQVVDALTGRYAEEVVVFFENDEHFLDRASNLKKLVPYVYSDEFHFRAGSYMNFSDWRNWLAGLAGYPSTIDPDEPYSMNFPRTWGAFQANGGPFWELIYFTDCNGVIDGKTSQKLLHDFCSHLEQAGDVGSYSRMYQKFMKAFKVGANNGAVVFA